MLDISGYIWKRVNICTMFCDSMVWGHISGSLPSPQFTVRLQLRHENM